MRDGPVRSSITRRVSLGGNGPNCRIFPAETFLGMEERPRRETHSVSRRKLYTTKHAMPVPTPMSKVNHLTMARTICPLTCVHMPLITIACHAFGDPLIVLSVLYRLEYAESVAI